MHPQHPSVSGKASTRPFSKRQSIHNTLQQAAKHQQHASVSGKASTIPFNKRQSIHNTLQQAARHPQDISVSGKASTTLRRTCARLGVAGALQMREAVVGWMERALPMSPYVHSLARNRCASSRSSSVVVRVEAFHSTQCRFVAARRCSRSLQLAMKSKKKAYVC